MKRRRIVITILVAAAVVGGYALIALNTRIGMFVGGGRYFVFRAASADTPDEARAFLRRVLDNTQYGVNIAENAVRGLPSREARIKLWRYLIEMAPNDNWREIYRRDLEKDLRVAERP